MEGKRISALLDAVAAGDLARARELDAALEPSNRAIMGAGQGATYAKQAVYALGLIESPCPRLPLVEPSETETADIRQALVSQGLLQK